MARRRARLRVAVLSLLAGVLVLAVSLLVFPDYSVNHDEAVYLQQASLLLHGQLFFHPPVEGAFRPWFFVDGARGLYAKYAPYPAIIYAAGMAVGSARLALAVTATLYVALVGLVAHELTDVRTSLLAAGFALASPLFLVDAATFLPYVPVAVLTLAFALTYLRAERQESARWAALAGACIGLAFFARPYTAVLFAVPFVAHALWTLRKITAADSDRTRPPRGLLSRRVATATLGLAGVALALAYNTVTTGHPLVFPYAAFAPMDGIGFGPHKLRGYAVDYTPIVALRANAVVLASFFSAWVAGGLLGSALAVLGLARTLRDRTNGRLLVLAGLFVSVPLGNLYFWGNRNLLGANFDPTGLLAYLGPYYHLALLLPTSVFAAIGIRRLATLARPRLGSLDRRVALPALALVCLLSVAAVGGALAGPLSRNAANTQQYEEAYEPVSPPPADSVVFLPPVYGDWLNHPFQALRNPPGFDGHAVYAIDGVNSLNVTRAYPNRTYYRYEYRGTWVPTDALPVHPRLTRVHVTRGQRVVETLTVRLPPGTDSASVRVATGGAHAYYALNATPGDHTMRLAVNDSRVRVAGRDVKSANVRGRSALPVNASDEVTATVYVETGPGTGVTYRSRLPVGRANGTRAALTPYLEACTDPRTCGGGAAYFANSVSDRYFVNATLAGSGRGNTTGENATNANTTDASRTA